jgi:hypothetical protein
MFKTTSMLACLLAVVAAVGCGGSDASSTGAGGAKSEAVSAASGDIPDNQVFLAYRGPGYSVKYPEGWTKRGSGTDLSFVDKDNAIHLVLREGSPPIRLHGGRGKVTIHRLGEANTVTGKRPRLIIDRYVYAKGGRVAVLDLATPKGVDNVDAYRLISKSFRWR